MRIPKESLVLGHPAKVIRQVSPKDRMYHEKWVREYVLLKDMYKTGSMRQTTISQKGAVYG
jgi:carbonic anhydrase/acetyltransferase-like protein (isoleucine patch superfamily)